MTSDGEGEELAGIATSDGRQLYLLTVADRGELLRALLAGRRDPVTVAIAVWCQRCQDATLGKKQRCLTCERAFVDDTPPERFIVFGGKDRCIIIGQCEHCAPGFTSDQVAARAMAKFPDVKYANVAPGGTA